ncbi:MAG: HD domain-containing protein [Spirochaetes bacterium]|nr:HD domain-containing protein [Spirochaetota bacterium]
MQQNEGKKVSINLNYLRPYSNLVFSLYSIGGEKILNEYTLLTPKIIEFMKNEYGNIVFAYETRRKGIISEKNLTMAVDTSRTIVEEINKSKKITKATYREAEKVVDSIITDLDSAEIEAINLLQNLKFYEEYSFQHSVNVGILAAIFARLKGTFSKEEIKFLTLGAYLLDIGLTRIEKKLLLKKDKYTPVDMQKMKQHPQFGYEILKNIPGIHPIVLQTLLFHHEKHNYKGYYSLPYDLLPLPPKIVSICDIYDALTSPRPYRNSVSPTNALKFLVNSIDIHFDYDLISDFVNKIGPLLNNAQSFYTKGDFCALSTKELAMIMDFNLDDYMRPKVMVFCKFAQKQGNLKVWFYDSPVYTDLAEDKGRYLTRVIDNKKHINIIRAKLIQKGMIK